MIPDRPVSYVRLATRALPWLLMLIVAVCVLSLSTFPVITNDSLTYLDYSRSLSTGGLVIQGHRQFGYPLFLAALRWVARIPDLEPLLLTVVIQRGLLLACMLLAWLRWRWWSVPLIAVLLTSETMIYANLVLAEGFMYRHNPQTAKLVETLM